MFRRPFSFLIALFLLSYGLLSTLNVQGEDSAETLGAIYRVTYNDADAIRPFLEFDIWQDRITAGSINVRMTDAQLATVMDQPVKIELLPQSTASLYVDRSQRDGDTIPGFSCYRTVEKTESDLATLAANYPTLVEVIDIGDSYDKVTVGDADGYDMLAYKATNQATSFATPKPIYMILAAVHAREYTTAETATRFLEQIVEGYGSDPDATWLLDNFELHVIPQGNPDGRKIAESADISQRKNTNRNYCANGVFGVDLNRNVSYQWNVGGSSGSTCSTLYRGPSPASEVETMAFEAYASSVLPDQRADSLVAVAPETTTGMFITLHSAIPAILPAWAWTDYETNPNFAGHNAIGRKMAYFNDYRVYGTNAGIGSASGTHDDFVYGTFGIPAFTYEMGNTFYQQCATFESTIYPDNFDALLYGFKAAYQPYTQAFGPDIESLNATSDFGDAISDTLTVTQGQPFTLTVTANDNLYHQDSFYTNNVYGVDASIDVQAISAITVSVGLPSWQTPTTTIAMNAFDGAFDAASEIATATIDTTGWSLGKHLLLIEATDSDGVSGVPEALFVTVTDAAPTKVYLPFVAAAPASQSSSVTRNRLLTAHGALLMLTLTVPWKRNLVEA